MRRSRVRSVMNLNLTFLCSPTEIHLRENVHSLLTVSLLTTYVRPLEEHPPFYTISSINEAARRGLAKSLALFISAGIPENLLNSVLTYSVFYKQVDTLRIALECGAVPSNYARELAMDRPDIDVVFKEYNVGCRCGKC